AAALATPYPLPPPAALPPSHPPPPLGPGRRRPPPQVRLDLLPQLLRPGQRPLAHRETRVVQLADPAPDVLAFFLLPQQALAQQRHRRPGKGGQPADRVVRPRRVRAGQRVPAPPQLRLRGRGLA